MDNKIIMDDIEAFLLDFIAYRRELRERRVAASYLPSAQKHIDYHEVREINETLTDSIPYPIGKGWPHYKNFAKEYRKCPEPVPPQNEIIATLTPIVNQTLNHFGSPSNSKAINHLVCQVIATAMSIPQISESITASEIVPWGRVPLLQAVVELLIVYGTMAIA